MFGEVVLNRYLVDSRSCIRKAAESKWSDAALLITSCALLVIGILATCQIFNSIGTTNALYLSYGAYAGSACLFIAEMIKIAAKCRYQPINMDVIESLNTDHDLNAIVKKVEVPNICSETFSGLYFSEITFTNGQTLRAGLFGYTGYLFLNAIDIHKINMSREDINSRFTSTPTRDGIYQEEQNGAEVLKSILLIEYEWL
jgi:hypothetical protein